MEKHDDNFLKSFLGEHFWYEIDMLVYSVKTLAQSEQNHDQSGINMALDNFVAHGRNLLEFYYYTKIDSKDYARAEHFVDSETWEKIRPLKTELIKELERRASNEMVHLSFKRISGTPPEKTWNCGQCCKDLLVVTKKFLEILSEKFFSDTITSLKISLSNLPESSR